MKDFRPVGQPSGQPPAVTAPTSRPDAQPAAAAASSTPAAQANPVDVGPRAPESGPVPDSASDPIARAQAIKAGAVAVAGEMLLEPADVQQAVFRGAGNLLGVSPETARAMASDANHEGWQGVGAKLGSLPDSLQNDLAAAGRGDDAALDRAIQQLRQSGESA